MGPSSSELETASVSTTTSPPSELTWPVRALAIGLFCAFGIALLLSITLTDFWSPHEGRVVGVAANMLNSGDYWVPYLNGEPRLEKSPLVYWIVAASGALWGQVDEFSARLPSVLAGMACVLLAVLIGRTTINRTAALLGGLVQISTFTYWRDCRTAELDLYLTFFIALAMFAFCRIYFAGQRRVIWILLFWVAMGCGAATKNALTVLPALGTCGLALWFCRPAKPPEAAQRNRLWPWHVLGIAFFAVLALAWNISMVCFFPEHAPTLWRREIDSVLLHASSARPVYFYLGLIFLYYFPASVFVPAAFAVPFVLYLGKRSKGALFLFLWMTVQILSYSFWPASKKKIEYIMPMLPAFALLVGYVWFQLWAKQTQGRFNRRDRTLLLCHGLLIAFCGLTVIGFSLVDAEGRWIVAVLGAGLLLVALTGLVMKTRSVTVLFWGTTIACLAAMIINFVCFLPRMNQQVSPRLFAQAVADHGGGPSKVVIYKPSFEPASTVRTSQGLPPLDFYLGYDLSYIRTVSDMKTFLTAQPSGLVIVENNHLPKLPAHDLGLKIIYQQDISAVRVPMTSDHIPQILRYSVGHLLDKLQDPPEYTSLLGRDR